jgi:hypothetical protein
MSSEEPVGVTDPSSSLRDVAGIQIAPDLPIDSRRMSQHAFDIVVGPDGGVAAGELARLGVRPGDHLRLVAVGPRRPKSLLGAFPRDVGFTQDHLDEVRRDMGAAVGDDSTI